MTILRLESNQSGNVYQVKLTEDSYGSMGTIQYLHLDLFSDLKSNVLGLPNPEKVRMTVRKYLEKGHFENLKIL